MATIQVSDALYELLQQRAQEQDTTIEGYLASCSALQQTYDMLVDNSMQGLIIFQNNQLVFANRKATELTGYNRDELQQSSLMQVAQAVAGDDARQQMLNNVEKRLQGEVNEKLRQYQFRHRDGSLRWVELTSTRIMYYGQPAVQVVFVDVTERYQVQHDLEQSQSLYRALLAELPNTAIMVLDHHLRYVIVEGVELERSGYDKVAMIGHTLKEVVEPEFYEVALDPVKKALDDEKTTIDIEHRGQNYRVSYVPIYGSSEQPEYCLIVTINISDLKQAQAKQQALIEQLQLAIETVGLGMWEYDLQTEDFDWNQQLLDIYNISREDLRTGYEWHEFIHPDDLETAKNGLRTLFDGTQFDNVSFRILRDGQIRYIKASGRAIKDETGKLQKLLGTNLDVTDYEEIQRDLSVTQSQYEILFNGVMNPVSVFDEQGRVVMLNESSAAIFELPITEIVGRNLNDLLPDLDGSAVDEVKSILDSGKVSYVEREVIIQGETRWFASISQPVVSLDDKLRWLQVISYDITDKKNAEALATERKMLENRLARQEALTDQRSQMLSVLSHEFRTPMTIMSNAATMLLSYRDKLSVEAQNQKLDKIIQQINVLTMLLDDMSAHARQNVNFFDYRPIDVNISDMMREIIEEGRVVASDDHEIRLRVLTSVKIAHFDRRLMYHALNNLLVNAIKYSPQGGIIELEVDDKNNQLHFIVRDTGIGIPQEDFELLFKPFNRASNVGAIRGTGMGLSIVRDIADLHDGRVDVISDVGQGSVFSIIIPI